MSKRPGKPGGGAPWNSLPGRVSPGKILFVIKAVVIDDSRFFAK
jgi:hypothetical protein